MLISTAEVVNQQWLNEKYRIVFPTYQTAWQLVMFGRLKHFFLKEAQDMQHLKLESYIIDKYYQWKLSPQAKAHNLSKIIYPLKKG